jgi:hypothetical protein
MTGIACHRRDTSEWLFMNLTVVTALPQLRAGSWTANVI